MSQGQAPRDGGRDDRETIGHALRSSIPRHECSTSQVTARANGPIGPRFCRTGRRACSAEAARDMHSIVCVAESGPFVRVEHGVAEQQGGPTILTRFALPAQSATGPRAPIIQAFSAASSILYSIRESRAGNGISAGTTRSSSARPFLARSPCRSSTSTMERPREAGRMLAGGTVSCRSAITFDRHWT